MIFYSEHVKTNEMTVKPQKKQLNILSGTQLTVKQEDFASPCDISNFDGIENAEVD